MHGSEGLNMQSLARLITDTQLKEVWTSQGKEALTVLAQKEGVKMDEHLLENLLLQARDLAGSELLDNEKPEAVIDSFWRKVKTNSILLTKEDYLRATVIALSFAHRFARTDFGSSRQRGFGQLWGDTIQGILGEIAFRKFMKSFTSGRVIPILDASEERLEVALSADIVQVILEGKPINPKRRISIKTTKLNGRWLDVPYAQNRHSDIYVLVKIGTNADTLFNFLANIGAFERVLTVYRESKLTQIEHIFLNEHDALERAKAKIEQMKQTDIVLLAFMAGWQEKSRLSQTFKAYKHNARRARKKITIYSGIGTISSGNVQVDKINWEDLSLDPRLKDGDLKVKFYPIEEFSSSQHALCSTDLLISNLNCVAELLSIPEAEGGYESIPVSQGGPECAR
ncbi:hypothetical protein [Thermus sp. FJN-A]